MGTIPCHSAKFKPSNHSNKFRSENMPSFIPLEIAHEDSINEEAQNFESISQLKIDLESLLCCSFKSNQS